VSVRPDTPRTCPDLSGLSQPLEQLEQRGPSVLNRGNIPKLLQCEGAKRGTPSSSKTVWKIATKSWRGDGSGLPCINKPATISK